MNTEHFDLVVIGGGITGAGVALDAVTRGMTVALIERNDFASGTSSKSSKLVHGGLRYLENRDLKLVREAVIERDLLVRLAPYLVTTLPFYWPRWAGASRKAGLGLSIYDSLAGDKGIAKHRSVSADEGAVLLPGASRNSEGYMYYDAQTDDARLTMAVLRAARIYGAVICNYVHADEVLSTTDALTAVLATEKHGDAAMTISTSSVVNATGVWADETRRIEDPSAEIRLQPSKGVHVVLPHHLLPIASACLLPSLTGGLIFAVPWRSSVLVGTTDHDYEGPLDGPLTTEEESRFLLDSLSLSFGQDFCLDDTVSSYAGLRPLLSEGKDTETRDLSRHHKIAAGPQGMLSVTGGKLTTYRLMAEQVVDRLCDQTGRKVGCRTASLCISNTFDVDGFFKRANEMNVSVASCYSLLRSYADVAPEVLTMAQHMDLAAPLVEGLPYLKVEPVWAMEQEMAITQEDVLARRTRVSLETRVRPEIQIFSR
ncbi:MAG: glycerol-3-phosphate dehydrogenase/oxidase [Actinomycetota bacterium]